VRARIASAAVRAGRNPSTVTLVGVSKTFSADDIAGAIEAGLTDVGENRIQEAAAKIATLRARSMTPRWHLIGHLQRNKVTDAIDLFDILHSVDSERLARAIDDRAKRRVPALIEVNVSGEESKFGVPPRELDALVRCISNLPNIELRGLMTVAPRVDDPADVRPAFRTLRQLGDAHGLRELSMGMTDDFEVAVEEGATIVRVGRALFGPRPAAAETK
jgi:pyridoxal phosphate enzyme (YggS family)